MNASLKELSLGIYQDPGKSGKNNAKNVAGTQTNAQTGADADADAKDKTDGKKQPKPDCGSAKIVFGKDLAVDVKIAVSKDNFDISGTAKKV